MNKKVKWWLIIGTSLLSFGLLTSGVVYESQHILNYNQPMILSSKTSWVLFYRHDCKDCQKLYPDMIKTSFQGSKVTFVDLAQEKNRYYIQEFGVVEVPTLFQCDDNGEPLREWMGTKDIQNQFNKMDKQEG